MMKTNNDYIQCNFCHSKKIYIQKAVVGQDVGAYCSDCKRWIKWLDKDELRLAEQQIVAMNEKPMTIDEFELMCMQHGVTIVDGNTGEYKSIEQIFKELEENKEKVI